MMELERIRKKIDNMDFEILRMLGKRMELTLMTKRVKQEISDPEREKQVFQFVKSNSKGLVTPDFSEKLYREIIAESKRLQAANRKVIGYQGESGAFSEIAAMQYDKSFVPIPHPDFKAVFEGVSSGELDFGIVPVENSIEGAITEVNDLLVETDLSVIAEVSLPVHHCLLTLPETDYRDIKLVYSHPQALAQCRGFISRNKFEPRPYYDTAGSALMLSKERPNSVAVIASRLCAEIYGLEVLKENIEDNEENKTRFLVISREKQAVKGNKCSIIFQTAHKAGALSSVLKLFSDDGVNLTRIESRPMRKERGKFAFLLDFEGSDEDPKVKGLIEKVRKETLMLKFLGCYRGN